MVGDVTGAQSYASTAKKVNIVALVLGLLWTIGFTVLLVLVVFPATNNAIKQAGQNHGGYQSLPLARGPRLRHPLLALPPPPRPPAFSTLCRHSCPH